MLFHFSRTCVIAAACRAVSAAAAAAGEVRTVPASDDDDRGMAWLLTFTNSPAGLTGEDDAAAEDVAGSGVEVPLADAAGLLLALLDTVLFTYSVCGTGAVLLLDEDSGSAAAVLVGGVGVRVPLPLVIGGVDVLFRVASEP
jgi:hypothetical protein